MAEHYTYRDGWWPRIYEQCQTMTGTGTSLVGAISASERKESAFAGFQREQATVAGSSPVSHSFLAEAPSQLAARLSANRGVKNMA
jgi:hypothetical protein